MNKYQEALNRLSEFKYTIFVSQRESEFNHAQHDDDVELIQELVNKTNGIDYGNPVTNNGQTDYYCGRCGWWIGTTIKEEE